MKKLVGLFAAFAIMAILAFLTVNWTSTIPEPTNASSSEYRVYQNLTNTTDIAFTAQEAGLLLVAAALVFVAFLYLYKWVM